MDGINIFRSSVMCWVLIIDECYHSELEGFVGFFMDLV